MVLTCSRCGNIFYNGDPRSECFSCLPHPRVSSVGEVLKLYEGLASYEEVALVLGLRPAVVYSYIRNYGRLRSRGPKTNTQDVKLDMEWIDGWLLGDGNLCRPSLAADGIHRIGNAMGQHGSSQEQYTKYVVDKWLAMGLTTNGRIYPQKDSQNPGWITYKACTRVHHALTKQYFRWYPDDKKKIPRDVVLSPVVLREWYLGDGSLQNNRSPVLIMGGVSEEEVERMLLGLLVIFKCGVSKRRYVPKGETQAGDSFQPYWQLYFSAGLSEAFFSYIGVCSLSCYSYKWV